MYKNMKVAMRPLNKNTSIPKHTFKVVNRPSIMYNMDLDLESPKELNSRSKIQILNTTKGSGTNFTQMT